MRTQTPYPLSQSLGAFGIVLLLAGVGCGGVYRNGTAVASPQSFQGSVNYADPNANGGHPEETDYTCPAGYSVKPRDPRYGDRDDHYTVCASKKNTTDVLVFGTPHVQELVTAVRAPQICFFPIDIVSNQLYSKPDGYGNPMSSCGSSATSKGFRTGFALTKFNAALIVVDTDRDAASYCLKQWQKGLGCTWPAYSLGQFRD